MLTGASIIKSCGGHWQSVVWTKAVLGSLGGHGRRETGEFETLSSFYVEVINSVSSKALSSSASYKALSVASY